MEAVAAALLVHPCPWVAAEPARWMARLLAHCGAASRGAAWGWPRLPPLAMHIRAWKDPVPLWKIGCGFRPH